MWEEDVHARYHGYKMYQDTLYNDPARNGVLLRACGKAEHGKVER